MRRAAASMVGATLVLAGHSAVHTSQQFQPPPRVLVMPFSLESSVPAGPGAAPVWLGEAATILLADELTAQGFPAFGRDDCVDAFERLNVPMSPELTRATMVRIAELMGASDVVFGEVTYAPELTVRARAIRLDTGQLLPEMREAGPLADVFSVMSRLARALGQGLGRPPATPPVKLPALSLPVLENYIKGLMAAAPPSQQKFLESAMTQAPRDGRVLTALWSVYSNLGVHDKALSVASAVPVASPQYRLARWQVSLSLIELRRFDGALKELAALQAAQRSPAIVNAMGVAELRRTATVAGVQAASVQFDRAVKDSPDDPDYLFNLGYARALAGDHAAAVTWLREAVRRNPADGDAPRVMAGGLAARGPPAPAQPEADLARLLGTSLETMPKEIRTVPPGLERVRLSLIETVPRAALGEPAQRDQTETARFHLQRGRALLAEGRDREASAELRRAIYLAPYEAEPHLLLGDVYRRAGRHAEAIDELKVAVWSKDSAAARIALGRAYYEAGEPAAARSQFERALQLAPDSAEARDWLKKIGGGPPGPAGPVGLAGPGRT